MSAFGWVTLGVVAVLWGLAFAAGRTSGIPNHPLRIPLLVICYGLAILGALVLAGATLLRFISVVAD